MMTMKSTKTCSGKIEQLRGKIENTDTIVIGAGAGLSTSAGFTYSGERFQKYFNDFIEKYHFRNMYEGGFYSFDSLEKMGHIGVDIFTLTAIWIRQNLLMKICMNR